MLLTLGIALLSFLALAGLGLALSGGSEASRAVQRVQGLGEASVERRRPQAQRTASSPETRRKQILLQLQEADRRERKARVTLAARLRQAGLTTTVRTFWMISAGIGVGVLLFCLLVHQKPLFALGFAIAGGLGLPRWVVGFLAARRTKRFTSDFANAIDIIVRSIKSGLPVHDALKVIANESAPPLGPEFQKLVENISVGLTLEQALEKMYERMPTPELRFFTIVIGIQAKTGGNLAEALSNLSVVLRSRKLMREKIKALSSEAIASAGIIGSLPPAVMLLVLVFSRDYMIRMFTDPRGNLMLLGAGIWMGMGIFVMKKMISFKI